MQGLESVKVQIIAIRQALRDMNSSVAEQQEINIELRVLEDQKVQLAEKITQVCALTQGLPCDCRHFDALWPLRSSMPLRPSMACSCLAPHNALRLSTARKVLLLWVCSVAVVRRLLTFFCSLWGIP